MHLTILAMLSSTSLSAFSANFAASRLNGAGPVRPVRDLNGQSRADGSGAPSGSSASKPALLTAPGQKLPRGSLLDLSV